MSPDGDQQSGEGDLIDARLMDGEDACVVVHAWGGDGAGLVVDNALGGVVGLAVTGERRRSA